MLEGCTPLSYSIAFAFQLALFLVVLIVGFVIANLHMGTSQTKPLPDSFKFLLKLCAAFDVLLMTVFTYPSYIVVFEALLCRTDDSARAACKPECWSGHHLALVLIAAMVLIFLTSYLAITSLLLTESFLDSEIPWAATNSPSELYKTILKIILSAYFVFDRKGNAFLSAAIAMTFLYGGLLYQRCQYQRIYMETTRKVKLLMEASSFWIFFVVSLLRITNSEASWFTMLLVLVGALCV